MAAHLRKPRLNPTKLEHLEKVRQSWHAYVQLNHQVGFIGHVKVPSRPRHHREVIMDAVLLREHVLVQLHKDHDLDATLGLWSLV